MKIPSPSTYALLIALFCGFLTPFDLSAVTIALPSISKEFSLDAVTLAWISSIYLLASAVFLVPFGRIGDIYGRKKVLTLGVGIFTLASGFMILSYAPESLIISRLIQGIGASMIFGTGVAILTSVTSPAKRGHVLGIYTTLVYIGLSAGPAIGGLLTSFYGWRSIFLINIPIGLIILFLLFCLKGEWADAAGERFDLTGAVLYGCCLTFVIYGLSLIPDYSGFIVTGVGLLLFIAFVYRESGEPYPLINISMFKENTVFAFSNAAAFINYGSTYAISFFLSLYLQYIRGFDSDTAGLVLVIQPVIQAVFSSSAGNLSDRIEPGKIATLGMAVTTCGLVMLAFLSSSTPVIFLCIILVVLGLGLALFSSPNTNAIMSSVKSRDYGVASGTLGTMRLVGQTFAIGISMMILAVIVGRVEITQDVSDQLMCAMTSGFIIFSIMCGFGVIFSMIRKKRVY